MAMPRTRKQYRKKPRRRTYRRRKTTSRRARLPRTLGPPAVTYMKLKIASVRQQSIALNSLDVRQWGLNCLYDTDITGVGVQPVWFDQMMAFYSRYLVVGAKIRVDVSTAANTANIYPATVVGYPSVSLILATNLQSAIAQKGAKYKMMIPGQTRAILTSYFKINQLFGIPRTALHSEDNYNGTSAANPVNLALYNIWIANNDSSSSILSTTEINITFYCKFFNVLNTNYS